MTLANMAKCDSLEARGFGYTLQLSDTQATEKGLPPLSVNNSSSIGEDYHEQLDRRRGLRAMGTFCANPRSSSCNSRRLPRGEEDAEHSGKGGNAHTLWTDRGRYTRLKPAQAERRNPQRNGYSVAENDHRRK